MRLPPEPGFRSSKWPGPSHRTFTILGQIHDNLRSVKAHDVLHGALLVLLEDTQHPGALAPEKAWTWNRLRSAAGGKGI